MKISTQALRDSLRKSEPRASELRLLKLAQELASSDLAYHLRVRANQDSHSKADKELEKNLYNLFKLNKELEIAQILQAELALFLTSENNYLRTLANDYINTLANKIADDDFSLIEILTIEIASLESKIRRHKNARK